MKFILAFALPLALAQNTAKVDKALRVLMENLAEQLNPVIISTSKKLYSASKNQLQKRSEAVSSLSYDEIQTRVHDLANDAFHQYQQKARDSMNYFASQKGDPSYREAALKYDLSQKWTKVVDEVSQSNALLQKRTGAFAAGSQAAKGLMDDFTAGMVGVLKPKPIQAPHSAPIHQQAPHPAPIHQQAPHSAPIHQQAPHSAPIHQQAGQPHPMGARSESLPQGWTQHADPQGRTYYQNANGYSQWERPTPIQQQAGQPHSMGARSESLPQGWTQHADPQGRTYYQNSKGQSQWERPHATTMNGVATKEATKSAVGPVIITTLAILAVAWAIHEIFFDGRGGWA